MEGKRTGSIVDALSSREESAFRSLVREELSDKVASLLAEMRRGMAPSLMVVENLPGAPSAPPAVKPVKAGDIRIVPTAAGAAKDDISLDPNFEKEFYQSMVRYKGQTILLKQLGTGFGKPVRAYVNNRRWEFFPGPKAAIKATKQYIDDMLKDVRKDPNLAANMTAQVHQDKMAGVSQPAAPVDAGKPNEVADANLKKKELETGVPSKGPKAPGQKPPAAKKPPAPKPPAPPKPKPTKEVKPK